MVKLVIAEPGYYAYDTCFDSIPQALRELFGDKYTVIQPFDTPKIGVICFQDQSEKKFNRRVTEDGEPIYGRFAICGMKDGHPVGLEPRQVERYRTLCYLVQSENMDDEFPVGKVRPKDERFGRTPRFWGR